MIVPALLCVIAIFTWCQLSAARRVTAFLFAAPTIALTLVSGHFNDHMYYISAALTDSLIIILLAWFITASKLAVQLMVISLISMCLNLVGLMIYKMHQSPTIYNALFMVLYTGVVFVLADRRSGSNVGMGGIVGVCFRRRRHDYPSHRINHRGDSQV